MPKVNPVGPYSIILTEEVPCHVNVAILAVMLDAVNSVGAGQFKVPSKAISSTQMAEA